MLAIVSGLLFVSQALAAFNCTGDCCEASSLLTSCALLHADCGAGSFYNVSKSGCSLCPLGRATSLSFQTTCQLCETGRFTDELGLSGCDLCRKGTFQNTTGKTSC